MTEQREEPNCVRERRQAARYVHELQFARLLAELSDAGAFHDGCDPRVLRAMGVDGNGFREILSRARRERDRFKDDATDPERIAYLDALRTAAQDRHATSTECDVEVDELWSPHLSEGVDGVWVRAWVLVDYPPDYDEDGKIGKNDEEDEDDE